MYIDVNVGNGRTGRIKVREGDDLHVLSRNFAKTFQLDRQMMLQLEEMLREAYAAQISSTAAASPEVSDRLTGDASARAGAVHEPTQSGDEESPPCPIEESDLVSARMPEQDFDDQ